ncbi:MAG: 4'-phosphopantetheinyl transferase superfamily protein [Bdellovibrionales bacterium]|nr:4'-phosphopantetheinyl transferase superfamily protein [Bdellovibrionales bacterium]
MWKSPFNSSVGFAAVDTTEPYVLHPDELRSLSDTAIPHRIEQFRLGRGAAQRALQQIGITDHPPVLKDASRAPIWPQGIVGTISHTGGLAVAAVGFKHDYLGLGVDIEKIADSNRRLRYKKLSLRVCHDDELNWIYELPSEEALRFTSLFSAKETLFKALFPVCRSYIGFKDAHLTWHSNRSEFEVTVLREIGMNWPKPFSCSINLALVSDYVLTSLALPNFSNV